MSEQRRICIGVIVGAHGVRGALKVRAFTADPNNLDAYGVATSEDRRRRFTLKVVQQLKADLVLATAKEVETRDDAERLSGSKLYVDRDRLPPIEEPDEYYHADLIGLAVRLDSGAAFGAVVAVHQFGAGDILEISGGPDTKGSLMVPLTHEAVPHIDLAAGSIVISAAAIAAVGPTEAGAVVEVVDEDEVVDGAQAVSGHSVRDADATRQEDA